MAFPPQSPQCSLHPPDLHLHLGKLRKALTCSICHQLLQKPACLHCNHHFCMSCLLQSMEEMSACPKCKQPAAPRQARFAPEMDSLVEIFQSLETASGPIIANSEDSQLENLSDVRNVALNVKIEDECLSPSALKRQRRYESRERVSSIATGATEADNRKRDASSMELPCRGILPAPKRIQLPCPPLPTDRDEGLGANLEKEMASENHPTLDNASMDFNGNASLGQQKLPVFAHATIGGQARSTGPAVFSHDEKASLPMGIHGSTCEKPDVSGYPLGKKNESAALHHNDHAQERVGVHVDLPSQELHGSHKKEVRTQVGCPQDQLADGNARRNILLPTSQADQGTEKVTCAFCHMSDSQVAGPMIHYKKGIPVSGNKRSGKIFSVHKNCAEWAPGVYYEDDVAKNIPQEVARGHKIKCHVCGLRGAVLGCYVKRCRKSFHYPCAHTLPCRWDDGNFLVFCPEHVASRFPDEGPNRSTQNLLNTHNSSHEEEKARQPLFADGCGHQNNVAVPVAAAVEGYIPGLPAEVEACNEESSQPWPASKWVLCGSGLSPKANELLATFVNYSGLMVEKTWTSSVTHLIVGTDEVGAARRTFKYLMANLEGKWILKIDWLSACMAAKRYVNEEPYEVNLDIHGMIGGPRRARGMAIAKVHGLFEGMRFYFFGEFAAAYRADLQALLTSAGGLVLNRMPDSLESDLKGYLLVIYSKDMYLDTNASHREELNKSSRYLEAKALAGMVGAKIAGHTWILDSVAAYELQPFE